MVPAALGTPPEPKGGNPPVDAPLKPEALCPLPNKDVFDGLLHPKSVAPNAKARSSRSTRLGYTREATLQASS
jgi:hypothetical protein